MKVLHLNFGQKGGAALCAQRISNALREKGVDSRMLYAKGEPNEFQYIADQDAEFWNKNWFTQKLLGLMVKLHMPVNADALSTIIWRKVPVGLQAPYFHVPLSKYKNLVNHPLVREADIIHLHWVPEFIDYPTFFRDVKKPIVWTMHDMHPFLGLMHFESSHTKRPLYWEDINDKMIKLKCDAMHKSDNLHIVAISKMMEDFIINSVITRGFPTSLIHNGVDVSIFRPVPVSKDPSKISFMFSSYSIWDRRKGLQRVIDALSQIDIPNIELIIVGNNFEVKEPKAPFKLILTGSISDETKLAELYSQADFFINASYEEAFAQTPLEAMACGTPVIATPYSGAEDLSEDYNGVVCEGFEVADLRDGIIKALSKTFDRNTIRQNIIKNYSYDKIADLYLNLYNECLS